MPVVSLASPGPPCLAALVAALAEVRGGDPLAPATVVVPGVLARLHVRRALGRLGGIAGIEVVTAAELAERLSRPARLAAGIRSLPSGGWEEAVRVALAADPGPFRAVAHHPAAVQRVAAALRRLRPATHVERAAVAARSGPGRRARHLVRLLEAVERGTSGHELPGANGPLAGAALAAGADPGPVVAFCPRGAEPDELELLVAVAATGRLAVVAATVGEPQADAPLRELVERIGGALAWAPVGLPAPAPAHLVLAADAETEARLVVQHAVAALEAGAAGHQIAVLSFGGPTGLGRLADLLDAAGVAWSGPAGHSLAAMPSGRALLALLGLDGEGWSHAGLLAALGAAPLWRGSDPLPLGRWAALARQANVVGGQAQWRDRPALLAGRRRRIGDDATAAELDDLAGFVEHLGRALHPPPEPTWTALSTWALAVLDDLVGPATVGWPEAEVAGHARVRAAVAALADLDQVQPLASSAPGPADLQVALASSLAAARAPRRGRVGIGVLVVTDPVELVGMTPALLLLSGMVEGAAPARHPDDPLVPEAELGLVAGASTRAVRRASERASVLAAVGAARRAVAFSHRADAQAARRPSRWFLRWAGALAGATEPLGADDLEHTAGPWLSLVPSFTAAVCGPVAGSVQERRLSGLARLANGPGLRSSPLVAEHPALRRAVTAAQARRSGRFTAWDGLLGRRLALDGEVSASALEDWAACPQRYLLRHELSVVATGVPGDVLDVDSGDRGTLAHEVLRAVVQRSLGRPRAQAWDDADRAFVAAELARRADGLRRQGRLGAGVLADLRIDELQATLLAALDHDDAVRAEQGWSPVGTEMAFGEGAGRPVALTLASGRTLRFRGRIDRVDVDTDGGVRVVDYKTGRAQRYLDAAEGGAAAARLLQLGIYEAAARSAHPGAAVTSGWWLLDVVGRDGRPLPLVANRLSPTDFSAALEAIAEGIEGGVFPADPGEEGYRGPDNCRFCPYDRVCRVDRVRALQRVAGDPVLAPWRALRAVGEAVAGGDDDG